ncbi:MAG: hypothetical protein WCX97_02410 [Candidatus Magasanikbacteria bacterium]
MNLIKKVFTFSVVATTIMWSLGVAALVPTVAQAEEACIAGLVAGDMVKTASSPTIYVLDNNLKVSSFINNTKVGTTYYSGYKTWNADESYSFKTVSYDCIEKLGSSPQYVGYRPGSTLIKHPITGSIYAVGLGRVAYKLTDEVAKQLYGTNYKTATITNMEFGAMVDSLVDWTEAKAHPGMFVKKDGLTYFVNTDKTLTQITAEGLTANRVKAEYVRTLDAALLPAAGTAAAVTAYTTTLGDRSQSGVAGGTGTATNGALTVALSAATPAAVNIPDGTSFNPVLKITLAAGPEAVTVNGLTLNKGGYISNTYLTGIDIVDGNDVRHGNMVSSVNSDNQVIVLFGSNPVIVPAGGSVTLTVRVNVSASADGGTIKMGVGAVDSTAATIGGLPVYGNEFNVVNGASAVASASVDVMAVSGASGTTLNADSDNEQEITKFRISETGSQEDLKLIKLTLFNLGSAADADYRDVQLVATDGTVLATAQPVSQYVIFDLSANPYKIDKGQYKDLTVRAKIVSGAGTSKYIQFVIYNDYDLAVKGATTGAYVLSTYGSNDTAFPVGDGDSTTTWNKVTIGTGTLSFNKDASSPSNAVAPGATNVVLAKYYVKAIGEDMELRKVNLGIVQVDSALTGNVYIKVNGANVWSGAASGFTAAGTAVGSFALNSYPLLTANQVTYITVEGNVPSTATSGVSYTVNDMDVTEVRKILSNAIADPTVVPADGNQISVNAASLSAKTLTTPMAQSIVAGTTGFTFANIELSANTSGEEVRISSLVISDTGTDSSVWTHVANLVLYDGTNQLTTSNSTATNSASTTFTFSTPLMIAKGATKTLTLKADVVSGTSLTHIFRLHSVSATGKDTGTTVSVTPSGDGQAMTLTSGPTVVLSLVSGAGASPSTNQVVQLGTNDGTYFAFKITPSNEAIKLRTLKLTATGTAFSKTNNVVNVRLYRNSETTPFASQSEMTCDGSTDCYVTWTATDNLLPEAVQPGSPVTIYVKADIGGAGQAKLGDSFAFSIASSTTDFKVYGQGTASLATVTGLPAVSGHSYIVPFTVKVEGVSPTAAATVGLSTGANVGVFKVTNLGNAEVAITKFSLANGGASTSTLKYDLKYSVDGGSQTDVTGGTASSTLANTTAFGTLTTPVTIGGNSWRYFTVKTSGTAVNYDYFQLSVGALGDILYEVKDTNLGYDGNVSGAIDDSYVNTGLYTSGTPSLESVTARS